MIGSCSQVIIESAYLNAVLTSTSHNFAAVELKSSHGVLKPVHLGHATRPDIPNLHTISTQKGAGYERAYANRLIQTSGDNVLLIKL